MEVALGSMRLSTDAALRAADHGQRTIGAALEAGVRIFDTAHAYALDDADMGHHERLLAQVLSGHPDRDACRVITKCGMTRPKGGWVPDGRARTLAAQAEASARALGGVTLDTLLLHAPDPRVPLETSVRALDRLRARGIARRVGLSNVSRRELRDAAKMARIDVVQIALGPQDDAAARDGLLALARELGVSVMAYHVLGGPKRAAKLMRQETLTEIARARGATPISVLLSYLARVHPDLVLVVGASRPETARAVGEHAAIALSDGDLEALDARYAGLGAARRPPPRPADDARREVVVIMGVPGSGKSTLARPLAAQGYERLNRDELGGTLRGITARLDARLAEGAERFVLDNTYLSRALRADVIRTAHRHGARVRCVHLDTPPADAFMNVVTRMLTRHGTLLGGAALAEASRTDPQLFLPTVLHRAMRTLDAPEDDEGFSRIERVAFVRSRAADARPGALIADDALFSASGDLHAATLEAAREIAPRGPWLVYAWRPDGGEAWAARARQRLDATSGMPDETDISMCIHSSGPPTCWCRPPLPGLAVAFALARRVDLAKSVVIAPATHRAFAEGLGARFTPRPR